ncbi:MAG TPA: POTRA domain-containing protein [Flavisolibacter sp.]|nr:POTRA domain-containing protein [Flavisolibacter sp.]
MQRYLSLIFLSVLCAVGSASVAQDTSIVTSVDPSLLALQNARVPKEYTIRSIRVTGITTLDTAIVLSISGLQAGQKLTIPGSDVFSKAITNLWRQRFFSNVQIFITAVQDDFIDLELNVQERPKLGNFSFVGPKKSEREELQTKIQLVRGTIITENTRRNAIEIITKFYAEKGYKNVQVRIDEKTDPNFVNSLSLTFYVDKGSKVRVDEVRVFGNETVSDIKLKKQMKGTKEMSKATLNPTETPSPFGVNDRISFKEYISDLGFLSPSKTRNFIDPYFRFKLFAGAKFDQKKFEEDLDKVLAYYNSLGYRDAQIVDTALYYNKQGNLLVDVKVEEGRKYYFGNITWKGNTKYSDSLLNALLGIEKGDIYNIDILNARLGKQLSQDGGTDISSLYVDDGYLFFSVDPVETAVYNDTIDYELRVREGTQARYRNIVITGNEKTKDYVVRRELRTRPGELFSRADIIRSSRELAALNYFNQEKINPNVVPNQEDGTVDVTWELEEKSSDQLELSAGWGGGVGLTGTLGVTFNNFSINNIFKKQAWDPLPQGDGQRLSLRYQSNGRAFSSYNFSFTEPWLGGKKRNSLTLSLFHSKFSNAYDFTTGRFDKAKSDTNYLKTTGISLSLGKQLKWPDDFFSLIYSLSYTRYSLRNYPIFQGLSDGTSTNVSFKIGLQRSSVYDPTFPRSGSNFVASVQLTPPYSALNPDLVKSNNPYKNPEFHKWRFNAEWFVPIGKAMGADKNRQFVLKLAAKYGFMGRYNRKLDFSPFERFQLGGDGLTNNAGLLGYDIIALRGYPVFDNSNPSVNDPDQTNANRFFTIFNKYQLELRYPLVTNPSSTIYALTFFDAANGWYSFKDYNPFRLRRSVGVGMRFFLPMFGLLGFDYGLGLDRLQPGDNRLKNATRFTFMLGFEPE